MPEGIALQDVENRLMSSVNRSKLMDKLELSVTVPLRRLPYSRDQATLAAFWRQVAADPRVKDPLKQFPRGGAPAPCRIAASADRPDGTCATQISMRDPRHEVDRSGRPDCK